jgi:hypothetical protein
VGTLLNLARCYQANGQVATAWATFREAAAAARAGGQPDREARARSEASALEPQLPRLTIQVDDTAERTDVLRDGVPVPRGIWGVAVPVDPGPHRIEARSPGKKPWSDTVAIAKAASAAIRVPVLAVDPTYKDVPSSTVVARDGEVSARPSATQRDLGMILGGVGVVGIAAGGYFGLRAISQWHDSRDACKGELSHCPNADGPRLHDDANRSATISTIAFAAGGAALATGAVLYFTAPKAGRATALRVSPGPAALSIDIEGRF